MESSMFPTQYSDINAMIEAVDPVAYGKTRNFIDGGVTRLSPYISRGVISTRQVMAHVLDRGYDPYQIEKFLQELAWRDYWQQVWIAKGEEINQDLKRPQPVVDNSLIPRAIVEGKTGVEAIDAAIADFYETGYMHNHVRMYVAFLACNLGRSHWKVPARWLYYHLLDADWASNALSWQWVAGANANKKYIANQENINKYCYSRQWGTFLDVPYEKIAQMEVPGELRETVNPDLQTALPDTGPLDVDPALPTFVYNFYNLDPAWEAGREANRILLLEPSHFAAYPVAAKTLDFILALSENIPGIQVHAGEFGSLKNDYHLEDIHYKEHPLAKHYSGSVHSRDWMFDVQGYFSSFFGFWKKCRKQL